MLSPLLLLPLVLGATVPGTYVDTSTSLNVAYVGCYTDSSSNRTLPGLPAGTLTVGAVTVQSCQIACQQANLTYNLFGVEYGGECWCGTSIMGGATLLSDSACNTACNGNTTQFCGGTNAINVYQQTALINIPTTVAQGATYLGCYSSQTLNYVGVNGIHSADSCIAACSSMGAVYSALYSISNAGPAYVSCTCYADVGFSGLGPQSACSILCLTNSSPTGAAQGRPQWCGNSNSQQGLSVYKNIYTGPARAPSITAARFTYTSANGVSWKYSGCYGDLSTYRNLIVPIPLATVNITTCIDAAAAAGYQYAGLEYGTSCFAGNVLYNSTQYPNFALAGFSISYQGYNTGYLAQSACSYACTNNALQPCGGSNALTVFQAVTSVGFAPTYTDPKNSTISFLTCASDNSTNSPAYRTFPYRASLNASIMTPQLCAQACGSQGYLYAGVQYATECWCSSSAPTAGQILPQYTCTGPQAMKCTGNASLFCGGGNMLAVYQTTLSTSAASVGSYVSAAGTQVNYLGCYPDTTSARQLRNFVFNNAANNSVEACVTQCTGLGFPYAALSAGSLCFCGAAAPTQSGTPSCTTACTGSSNEICGGTGAASLYYIPSVLTSPDIVTGLTNTGALSSTDPLVSGNSFATTYSTGAQYIACAQDSASSRIMSTKATSVAFNQMTPQACVDACTLLGMPFSGVEWAQECWCNAVRPTFSVASNSDCMMSCTGNSGYACGNGNRISLYYNGGVSTISYLPTVNSYSLRGCFSDSIGSRTLRNRMTVNYQTMTPAICTAVCANSGYYYAGLEYGGECWCDNSIQNGLTPLASNATCGMPCTGQASAYCGGGNAINIYYNAGLTRTTLQTYTTTQSGSSGIVWNYKACWGEPAGGRGLPNPLNNNAIGTVQSCLEMGSAAGYNACGLEYGGECWCNSIAGNPYGGQVPESMCQTNGMVCRGNSLNYCGAGNIFSFYSTGVQSYTLF